MDAVAEFRSNVLLLLHCRYPEGLPLSQLESEYKLYFQQDGNPKLMLMGKAWSWKQLFQQPAFREDFITFDLGPNAYVKAIGKRSPGEMSLIAKLARYSHFEAAKRLQFVKGQGLVNVEAEHEVPQATAATVESQSSDGSYSYLSYNAIRIFSTYSTDESSSSEMIEIMDL